MNLLFRAYYFIRYLLSATNAHGIHSPFVFDIYTGLIRDEKPYYAFKKTEAIRARMLLARERIRVTDFGTGAKEGKSRELSLSYIAGHYVKPVKYGQLLFRLVNHFSPSTILEIGTSLGITTLYLALPDSKSRVITLEGCPETASVAKRNFETAGVKNIDLVTGEFSTSLPMAIAKLKTLDFVYFDGNHTREATLNYFSQCLPCVSENSVFVFDDIHWSHDMAKAWDEIRNNEAVTLSIDLYSLGLIFFRKGQPKQHFILRF